MSQSHEGVAEIRPKDTSEMETFLQVLPLIAFKCN